MTSKAIYNPYKLLTDDLVEKALSKEFGTNTRLESYKVVDFTKKGDNFASIVTSVQVEYDLDGTKGHQSYIAKIPHESSIESADMIEMIRSAYLREALALGPILNSMNKLLEDLKQPPIKAPKCFSSCADRGKEVMLAEDLRNYGFVMFDKTKGMDYKHATLLMEELGRFHATSILFEIGLKGSTIEKEFPPFYDPVFQDPDYQSLGHMSMMINGQAQLTIDTLNSLRDSDKVNQWWKNIQKFSGPFMSRNADASEKFNVLIHGDCWNNNMLFRYDQNGVPIDIRLVDFQMTRRSSPACDLVYFFYSSLSGEMRQLYKKKLLVQYYMSFSKVLLLADKPIPFTLEELEEEVIVRMPYGCISSMVLLPSTQARSEDCLEMHEFINEPNDEAIEKRQKFLMSARENNEFKSRILSVFDEMTSAGIFERRRTILNPYKLLTEDLVEEALQNDVGKLAKLLAFETRKFTELGDNYMSDVISIVVHFEMDGTERKTSYVVKLNPQREPTDLDILAEIFYKKEDLVLGTFTKGMNEELRKLDLPLLKVPTKYSSCMDSNKEVIIMNNLRYDGFVMFGRLRKLDVCHCLLVIEELARFHASYFLYEETLKRPVREQFLHEFDDQWRTLDHPGFKLYNQLIGGFYNSATKILESISGYENVITWIRNIHEDIAFVYFPTYEPDNKKFNVLCHGDCWNNNILFKYDNDRNPIDVRLLDFQISRIMSLACDLNYFLFTCITMEERQKNMNSFLVHYYLSFSKVLLLANKVVPFTFEELTNETTKYMLYGCFVGVYFLLQVMTEADKKLNFDELKADNVDEFLERQRDVMEMTTSQKEEFGQSCLMMIDELKKNGICLSLKSTVKVINNPYKLLTEKLLRETLHNDIKKHFELTSYEVKDFTKPGDNYSSIVTSVEVNFTVNGNAETKTYVVKMNPHRPLGEFFDKMMEASYVKEAYFLSDILSGLNKELAQINESPLKMARCFSKSLDKGNEIFLMTDLRHFKEDGVEKRFQMFDRKKPMDVNHAVLVLEELGRLHACSLLHEQAIGEKIEVTYPYFEEEWIEPGTDGYNIWLQMNSTQLESTAKNLSKIPKFEKASKFLYREKDTLSAKLLAMLKEQGKFTALSHSDCWNNNILFNYSEDTKTTPPTEVMFVDLQMCRKSSVICDLNYVFYISIDRETRNNQLQFLLDAYYKSFQRILTLGGRKIPFSRQELEDEFKSKMLIGFLIAIFILPVTSVEEELVDFDDICSDESLLRFFNEGQSSRMEALANKKDGFATDRYFSLLIEMDEAKIFDE